MSRLNHASRPVDRNVSQCVAARDSVVLLKGPRQAGKRLLVGARSRPGSPLRQADAADGLSEIQCGASGQHRDFAAETGRVHVRTGWHRIRFCRKLESAAWRQYELRPFHKAASGRHGPIGCVGYRWDEKFVGEVGEQRVHDGSFRYLTFQVRKRVWFRKKSFAPLTTLRESSEGTKSTGTRRSMVAKQHLEQLVLKIIPKIFR